MKKIISHLFLVLVTFSATAQVSKTVNVPTAGTLTTLLTATEKTTVTNLTVTGNIDARDFRIMRDDMPLLASINLSGVNIIAYTGIEGTYGTSSTVYPENEIPSYAFYNTSTGGKKSLISVVMPLSTKSIGSVAFYYCIGLANVSIPSSVTFIGYGAFFNCSALTSVTIPSSVTYIGGSAFYNCSALTSIYMNTKPLTIDSYTFSGVKTATCTLNVPYSTKTLYNAANYWKSFVNIVEPTSGFLLDVNNINMVSSAGSSTVDITANVAWTASSDQSWLTVSPGSGTGNNTLTLTAQANPLTTSRTANVTISASGLVSQTIILKQYEAPKAIIVTAGGLSTALNSTELSTINGLILTGSIDARDFKTMRDYMPLLASIDLSGVNILAYTGIAGTYSTNSTVYPENEIPSYAFYNSSTGGKLSLISVVMPLSTKSIGFNAFNSCSGLTSVNIPSSVTFIGDNAFYSCRGLTNINIPSSVTSIGIRALDYCTKLTEITVESGNLNYSSLNGVLFDKTQTTLFLYPNCKTSISYTIPNSVTSIGEYAFSSCTGLSSVIIPNSVTTIGNSAFQNCSGLTGVTIPSSVASIGNFVFNNCSALTSVTIPSSVTSIGSSAFRFCIRLISITIPSSVIAIGSSAFDNCTGLTNITIPSSVIAIGSYAFLNCTGLTNIYMNSKPLVISSYTFSGVKTATCILNVPYTTKTLYAAANYWKDFVNIVEPTSGLVLDVNSLNIPTNGGSSTVGITANAAWTSSSDQSWLTVSPSSGTGNNTLTINAETNPFDISRVGTITLTATGVAPQTITIMQAGTTKTIFVSAGNLANSLTISQLNGITDLAISGSIDARDFKTMRDNMPLLARLDLSNANIVAYTGTAGTYSTSSTVYPENEIPASAFYYSSTGIGKTSLVKLVMPLSTKSIGSSAFQYCTSISSITIPNLVSNIGNNAFYNCTGLSSVIIPNSVTIIGNNAYYNCTGLSSVIISNSVTTIGSNAFYNCIGLTNINIPSSVTSIGISALGYCTKLTEITVESGNLNYYSLNGILFDKMQTTLIQYPIAKIGGSYIIPTTVTTIGNSAFQNCSALTNVAIPLSVTTIGNSAFQNCSALTNVAIPLSVTTIGYSAFQNCSGLTSVTIPSSVTSIGSFAFEKCYALTGVTIPSSVTSIGSYIFAYCTALTNIYMNSKPLVIFPSTFSGVKTATCILNVPYTTKTLYAAANYWKDFVNIVEPTSGFVLDINSLNMPANGGKSTVRITANIAWSASSDQSWLTVNSSSGIGNDTIPFTAQANPSEILRIGTITVSASGVASQTITIIQAGSTKTIFATAGNLATILSASELNGITDLAISGNIDARDFKTMRDNMPLLARLDLSNANIVAYAGTAGTYSTSSTVIYPENEMPEYAFYNSSTGGKTSLVTVTMPLSTKSIGSYAFRYCTSIGSITISNLVSTIGNYAFGNCSGLSSITIPSSVISIGNNAFYNCSGLTSIYSYATIPVNLSFSSTVFYNINTSSCTLYVPTGSISLYQAAYQWKDFTKMVEITTALPSLSDEASIRVYPNPVIDNLTIQGADTQATISICDLSGRVLLQQKLNNGNSVSLLSLTRGHYILRLVNSNRTANFKISKQ